MNEGILAMSAFNANLVALIQFFTVYFTDLLLPDAEFSPDNQRLKSCNFFWNMGVLNKETR